MARNDVENLQHWRQMAQECDYKTGLFAKRIGVSSRQLRRYTHHFFGTSPQKWLNQQRMAIALEMLKKHRSVKVVAMELGFKQVSHFSRLFKHHHQQPPANHVRIR